MSDQSAGLAPDEEPPAHDAEVDALMAAWVSHSPDTIDVEAALASVRARRGDVVTALPVRDELAARRVRRDRATRDVPLWQRPTFRAAAALLVVLAGAAVWKGSRTTTASESFVTTMGTAQDVRLSDGTTVRLGPASRLTIAAGFGGAHRNVTLHGEAWFRVSHDESKPFAIRVGNTTVEDLGTAFLVRESLEREVSVRVAEGAVRLTRTAAAHDSTVTLRAGDGAIATDAGITVATGVVSDAEGAALAAGRLTFTDASLTEVQDALHRWYGVQLELGDSALASRHVTGDFTGEPLSRVAAVLGLALGVRAEVRGDTIALHAATGAPARP